MQPEKGTLFTEIAGRLCGTAFPLPCVSSTAADAALNFLMAKRVSSSDTYCGCVHVISGSRSRQSQDCVDKSNDGRTEVLYTLVKHHGSLTNFMRHGISSCKKHDMTMSIFILCGRANTIS